MAAVEVVAVAMDVAAVVAVAMEVAAVVVEVLEVKAVEVGSSAGGSRESSGSGDGQKWR